MSQELKQRPPYKTHYHSDTDPCWATIDAAGSYVAWHYTQEAADELTTSLNAADLRAEQIRALEWAVEMANELNDLAPVEIAVAIERLKAGGALI